MTAVKVESPHANRISAEEIHLPDLQETIFDWDRLEGYIQELRRTGVAVDVSIKGASRERARTEASLLTLHSLLRKGAVYSAQLRYELDRSRWVDTLIAGPQGVRLVRMAQ